MDWEKIKKLYPINKKITVIISRVEHYGAYVNLTEDAFGFIPIKELSWTGSIIDAQEYLKAGDKVDVIVINNDPKYKHITLSVIKAEDDPWLTIDKNYYIQDVIKGKVICIFEKVAYLDIEGKIEGVISISHLWMNVDRMNKALLVGDWVQAKIIEIDKEKRIVHLSVSELLKNEEKNLIPETTAPIGDSYKEVLDQLKFDMEKETERKIGLSDKAIKKIKRILVVDPDLKLSLSTSLMLESLGFKSDYALSTREAIEKFSKKTYDLVLTALGIPDQNGIILSRALREKKPHLPIVFQTAKEDIENFIVDLEKMELHNCLLVKPWKLKDLIQFINNASEGTFGHSNLFIRRNQDFNFIDKISRLVESVVDKSKTIEEIIKDVKESTEASFAIIFQLHLTTFETKILVSCGLINDVTDKDLYLLRFSPVKDVIYEKEEIDTNIVSGDKYKYLRSLGNFSSLIGQRIDISTEWGYGLFVFGGYENSFDARDYEKVKIFGSILSSILEREILEDIYKTHHKFIIAGRLSSALIHELKNEQQALFNNIEILKTDSVKLNSGELKGNDPKFLARFQESVNSLLSEQDKMEAINRLFLNLFREQIDEEVNLLEHITQLLKVIEPTAKKKRVQIHPPERNVPNCRMNTSRIDQVITNVIINATDHIPLFRKVSGKIWINLEYQNDDPLPIKIEITDNGPGIHTIHKDKVFNIFFTTKAKGAGLGLFISKALVESMNGKISIKNCVMFEGTTFLIELPSNTVEDNK